MTEVKARITVAEEQFSTQSKEFDAQYDDRVAQANIQREVSRQGAIDSLVGEILGTNR